MPFALLTRHHSNFPAVCLQQAGFPWSSRAVHTRERFAGLQRPSSCPCRRALARLHSLPATHPPDPRPTPLVALKPTLRLGHTPVSGGSRRRSPSRAEDGREV